MQPHCQKSTHSKLVGVCKTSVFYKTLKVANHKYMLKENDSLPKQVF